ncbi:hypothetical protein C2E21_0306 [Chlorella sorokiniana]|uniref:Uncharacterized protein n=1 Tax=Chlorella sorokiniana TaxID=3076 RepID=A0A2P6U4C1_CHLSO|nr:hypothetical protein C2E21_0306 [Chlorella sorokiniana]|eukprot:PRW61151.1 hypothetical protein C2E21_0306 [Chlorella sorokiniana]
MLQLYPWWRSASDGVLEGLYNREPEVDKTVLAQYYDVPVVSLRAAAWRLMHAGIEGFKVDKWLIQLRETFTSTETLSIPTILSFKCWLSW